MSKSNRLIQMRRRLQQTSQCRPNQVKVSAPARLPEMALASDVQILPSAYFVGKRKPISELPWLWRWLARMVYWHTGWASDYGVEGQAICTSREMAEELCSKPNWFMQELPINTPLPDETCKFRLMTFPSSDAADGYRKRRAPFIALPERDLDKLVKVERELDQLQACIEKGECLKA